MPRCAADAVAEMVEWKLAPHHLQTPAAFTNGEERLRSALAELVGAPVEQMVLANSASYGLHVVANGLSLRSDDEVIVAANDFPSDILPWMRLQDAGVVVRRVNPAGAVLSASEVEAAMTDRTKVVCLTWVHSFSGQQVDLDAIGEACRRRDALFVVNGAQGVGGIPIDVSDHPIDVLSGVGFKWLVGPYGTGFCWLGERALERVAPTKLYWKTSFTIDDFAQPELDLDAALSRKSGSDASAHDIFGTSNFFNFAALTASVGLVADVGVERINAHNLELADQLISGVDPDRFEVADRGDPTRLTSIVFLLPRREPLESVAARLASDRIDVAPRSGHIRLSPHFYNTSNDIDRALTSLNRA